MNAMKYGKATKTIVDGYEGNVVPYDTWCKLRLSYSEIYLASMDTERLNELIDELNKEQICYQPMVRAFVVNPEQIKIEELNE